MQSLTARRRDGKLILEIDERQFVADALRASDGHLRVEDRERFFNFVGDYIFSLTHDIDQQGEPSSWWQRLSQALAKAAASTGHGIRREAAPAATCGCNPEIHDGG